MGWPLSFLGPLPQSFVTVRLTPDGLSFASAALPLVVGGPQLTDFVPNPAAGNSGRDAPLRFDSFGSLDVRAKTLTDERSFRSTHDFVNHPLSGTVSVINGSALVLGVGTSFLSEVRRGDYFLADGHSEANYALITEVDSDTQLTLSAGYPGPTASNITGYTAEYRTYTPVGSSITANGVLSITANTTIGHVVGVSRAGDYPPYMLRLYMRLSQRIAGQEVVVGFQDVFANPTEQAVLVFDGADPSKVKLRTSGATGNLLETEVTLPDGKTTDEYISYEITVRPDECALTIERSARPLATHQVRIPRPYSPLDINRYIKNTGIPASPTTFFEDELFFKNANVLDMASLSLASPIPVNIQGFAGENGDAPFGSISLTGTTAATAIRGTTYTENASAFQGSIVSSAAADSAAGTGMRSVVVAYLRSDYTGPFYETVTLNGITPVNLSDSTKRYVELMRGATFGSDGVAAGTVSLYNGLAGAGTVVGSISAAERQTKWAHHYVPKNRSCRISSLGHGNVPNANGSTLSSRVYLRSRSLSLAGAIELQITVAVATAGSYVLRLYDAVSGPLVVGPALITAYVTPQATSGCMYIGDFSYTERG